MFTIENRKCTQSPLKAWYKQITAAFISIYMNLLEKMKLHFFKISSQYNIS